jgi:hypothetical protein
MTPKSTRRSPTLRCRAASATFEPGHAAIALKSDALNELFMHSS